MVVVVVIVELEYEMHRDKSQNEEMESDWQEETVLASAEGIIRTGHSWVLSSAETAEEEKLASSARQARHWEV